MLITKTVVTAEIVHLPKKKKSKINKDFIFVTIYEMFSAIKKT